MRQMLLAITTWEWLLLLLLLPLLFVPNPIGALSLLALPLLWLVRKLSTGHFFPPTPYNTAVLALALSLLISLSALFDIDLSFPKIAGLVMGIALFFAAVEHSQQRENGVWHILAAIILAGTAMAVFSIPFSQWPPPLQRLNEVKGLLPPQVSRLPGTIDGLINLNEIAGVLAWIVPLLAAVMFGYRRQLWQSESRASRVVFLILVACLAINLFVLLATRSRGGLISVTAAILVMLAIEYAWGRWLLLAGLIAALFLAFSFGPEQLLSDSPDAVESLGLQARMEIWSRGFYALEDFPLTGTSMNGFRRIVPVFYPLTVLPLDRDIAHAHNHLLQAGLDLGILGLIAYLATWFLSGGLLWKGLRQQGTASQRLRPLLIGLVGALTGGWVFGLLDAISLGAKPGFIWWLLLALVAATAMILSRKQPAEVAIDTAV